MHDDQGSHSVSQIRLPSREQSTDTKTCLNTRPFVVVIMHCSPDEDKCMCRDQIAYPKALRSHQHQRTRGGENDLKQTMSHHRMPAPLQFRENTLAQREDSHTRISSAVSTVCRRIRETTAFYHLCKPQMYII